GARRELFPAASSYAGEPRDLVAPRHWPRTDRPRRSRAARVGAGSGHQERHRRPLRPGRAHRRHGRRRRTAGAGQRPGRRAGGPLLVLAGAGSGKTRVLTARIAHLIRERAVAPWRIFAVTFTNKAAGEMRARVAALLGAAPRGLWIGTFHALSARLLRREAPLLGFGPNFTIYDQDDSESFIKRLLEQRGHSPTANPP